MEGSQNPRNKPLPHSVVAWEDSIHQKGRKQGPRIGTEPPKDFLCLPNVLALPSCEQRYGECFQGTSRGPERSRRTEALGVDRFPRALASILSPCSRPQPGPLCAEPPPIFPHANLVLPKGHRSCSVYMDQTYLGTMWFEATEQCMYPSLLDGRCPVCPLLGRQTLGTACLDSRLSGHCPFLGLGQDIQGLKQPGCSLHLGRDTRRWDACATGEEWKWV